MTVDLVPLRSPEVEAALEALTSRLEQLADETLERSRALVRGWGGTNPL